MGRLLGGLGALPARRVGAVIDRQRLSLVRLRLEVVRELLDEREYERAVAMLTAALDDVELLLAETGE